MAARNEPAASNKTAVVAEPELFIKRVFDAPRSLVFKAWTEAKHLERWQAAPLGFTVTTEKSDTCPGGSFLVCMRSPQGTDHWLQGVYREIVEPERIVFTHTWLDAERKPGKETLVTITLADLGEKTELTLHQVGFKSAQSRGGHSEGWNSTFDRLENYLKDL